MIHYIGISGRIGAGKDTLALGLNRLAPALWPKQSIARLGFGDLIKEVCIASFGIPRALAYGSQEDKRTRWGVNPTLTIRDVIKIIGKAYTDVEVTYWTRRGFEAAHAYFYSCGTPGEGVALFYDVRFPTECDWIHQRGGKVIRLLREADVSNEEYVAFSECALDGYASFDAVLDNRECEPDVTLAMAIKQLKQWGMVDGKSL